MASDSIDAQEPLLETSDGGALPSGALANTLRLSVRLLEMARVRNRPSEVAQAHAQVGRCYKALAAWPTAQSYLEQGIRWAHLAGSVDLAVDLTCDLAEVACSAAESQENCDSLAAHHAMEAARDHAFEAARMAGQSADPHWEVKVLLRVSEVLDRCGDHDDAISLQTRALTLISHDASQLGPLDPLEPTRSPAPATLM
jgi:tetratricopeptide (TPR) repeat protein